MGTEDVRTFVFTRDTSAHCIAADDMEDAVNVMTDDVLETGIREILIDKNMNTVFFYDEDCDHVYEFSFKELLT